MSSPHQVPLGAGSLAALWLQEWRTISNKVLLGSPASRREAHLVSHIGEDEVVVTLRVPEDQDIVLDSCPRSEWTRERLDLAAQSASSRVRGRKVVTILSCAQAVTGSVFVPQQARPQAGDIIRDHLRRKLPVPLEDLVLGHEIRAGTPGKLELAYLAVPKRQVEDALTRLCLRSSDIGALEASAGTSLRPVTIPYGMGSGASRAWIRRGTGLLGLIALLAPAAGFSVQAWRQSAILSELDAQVIAATEQVRGSTERLKAVYSLAGDLEHLTAVRAAPGVVVIWEELAHLLPDTSYLTAFDIKGREIHAEGLSASTTDLIQRLENSQHLHAVSLTGPVVFVREHGKERFALRALMRTRRFPAGEGG